MPRAPGCQNRRQPGSIGLKLRAVALRAVILALRVALDEPAFGGRLVGSFVQCYYWNRYTGCRIRAVLSPLDVAGRRRLASEALQRGWSQRTLSRIAARRIAPLHARWIGVEGGTLHAAMCPYSRSRASRIGGGSVQLAVFAPEHHPANHQHLDGRANA